MGDTTDIFNAYWKEHPSPFADKKGQIQTMGYALPPELRLEVERMQEATMATKEKTEQKPVEETKVDTNIVTGVMDHKNRMQHKNPPNWQTAHAWMSEGHDVRVTFERVAKPLEEESKKDD